jgi:hypothetical protein
MARDSHILSINSGSSSIKFSLYGLGKTESLILKGGLAGIGIERGDFQAEDQAGHQLTAQKLDLPDHDAAWQTLFDWLQGHEIGKDLHAVGSPAGAWGDGAARGVGESHHCPSGQWRQHGGHRGRVEPGYHHGTDTGRGPGDEYAGG